MAVKMFKKLQVNKLTSNFREAVTITEVPLPSVGPNEVLVKTAYSGVNATDINITAGRYFTDGKLPFDIGFEALGVIEKTGEGSSLKPGDAVLCITDCAYAEYMILNQLRKSFQKMYRLLQNLVGVVGALPCEPHPEVSGPRMYQQKVCSRGVLKAVTDEGSSRHDGKIEGLEMVANALEYLHSGANFGKVVVHL